MGDAPDQSLLLEPVDDVGHAGRVDHQALPHLPQGEDTASAEQEQDQALVAGEGESERPERPVHGGQHHLLGPHDGGGGGHGVTDIGIPPGRPLGPRLLDGVETQGLRARWTLSRRGAMDTLCGEEETVPTLDDDLGHPVELEPPSGQGDLAGAVDHRGPGRHRARGAGGGHRLVYPSRPISTWPGYGERRTRTMRPSSRLRPDLVVANREENRRIDVERLRAAGIPVWVTVIESVDQALRSLHRLLVDVLGADEPGWLGTAAAEWRRPVELPPARVVVPIWRDPWMVVGAHTFCGDLVHRLGLTCLPAEGEERYPKVDVAELVDRPIRIWCSCPTSPTPSAPTMAPRRSPASPRCWCRAGTSPGTDRPWPRPGLRCRRGHRRRSSGSDPAARGAADRRDRMAQTFRR